MPRRELGADPVGFGPGLRGARNLVRLHERVDLRVGLWRIRVQLDAENADERLRGRECDRRGLAQVLVECKVCVAHQREHLGQGGRRIEVVVHGVAERGDIAQVFRPRGKLAPAPRQRVEAVERLLRVGELLFADLHLARGSASAGPGGEPHARSYSLEQVDEGDEVAERLRHLLAVEVQHAVVHPVPRERVTRRRRLARSRSRGAGTRGRCRHRGCRSVAEQLQRHRRALDVPARAPETPRRVPRRFAGFGRLPECEVDRGALALVDIDARARALEQFFERAVRQRSVIGERVDLEVHALALDHVRVTVRDELRDELDHLRDPLGRPGLVVGVEDVQRGRTCCGTCPRTSRRARLRSCPPRGRGR